MTNPTSNFGWQMPTSTDLVTDLPADFEVFGQAVDTSLADLKGGTTGQVLAKASGTDMDFTWVAQDDSNAIQNALLTTTGDTIYASGASTPARLGIGSTGQVLTVTGGLPTWATPTAPTAAIAQIATGTISGSALTVSSLSSYDTIYISLLGVQSTTASQDILRLNGSSSSIYEYVYNGGINSATFDPDAFQRNSTATGTYFQINGLDEKAAQADGGTFIKLTNCKGTGFTEYECISYCITDYKSRVGIANVRGIFKSAAAISSFTYQQASGAGTFSLGTYTVWGA